MEACVRRRKGTAKIKKPPSPGIAIAFEGIERHPAFGRRPREKQSPFRIQSRRSLISLIHMIPGVIVPCVGGKRVPLVMLAGNPVIERNYVGTQLRQTHSPVPRARANFRQRRTGCGDFKYFKSGNEKEYFEVSTALHSIRAEAGSGSPLR